VGVVVLRRAFCGRHVFARRFETRLQRRGVHLIGRVHLGGDDRSRLQIHHVLGLVPEPRATVLQPDDACVAVRRRLPVLVRRLLPLALAVHFPRVLDARIHDALRFAQLLQIRGVVLARVLRTIVFIDASARRYVESTPATLPRKSPLESTIPKTRRNTSS
jgi:hypothetical protein